MIGTKDNWPIQAFYEKWLRNKRKVYIAAIVLPVCLWIIALMISAYPITFRNIVLIHVTNPLLLFFDVQIILAYWFDKLLAKVYITDCEHKNRMAKDAELFHGFASWVDNMSKGFLSSGEFSQFLDNPLGVSLHRLQANIKETIVKDQNQRWISEGKNMISEVLHSSSNIDQICYASLSGIARYTQLAQGTFFIYDEEKDALVNTATYAYNRKKYIQQEFKIGHGLVGEAAFERQTIYRTRIPKEYSTIRSGILGDTRPGSLIILPLVADNKIQGVLEFVSLKAEIEPSVIELLEHCARLIAQTLFALKANHRTENLLQETQRYTVELKHKQEILNKNAQDMQIAQAELEKANQTLEAKIREVENSEHRIHSILENASEVITIYDSQGNLKYESPSMKHVFGHAANEIKVSGIFYNLGSSGHPLLHELFKFVIQNPFKIKSVEYKYVRKNGDIIWLETTARNLLRDNAIEGIIFTTSDITIHKFAEQEQRMKGQMQALSENSPDMIVRLNPDGQFFYSNPVFGQLTGKEYKSIMKKFIEQVQLDPVISDFFLSVITEMHKKTESYEVEKTFPSLQGDRIMHVNIIPELNDEKALETVLIVAHDVTERKRIEMEIKEKNKKINESINYARHIQESILPTRHHISQYFPKSFLFYKPRDVVSGDFPWIFVKDNTVYVAAVDCTGHGVPGAMISFIGYFTLNGIVNNDKEQDAGEILNQLHSQVRRTLKQDVPNATTRDGMDIALCKILPEKMELHFAGAHRPLYLLRNNEIIQYDADRKAIGGLPVRNKPEKLFVNHPIQLQKNDRIFFFSDGLPDQEGGPDGYKYNTTRIKNALLSNCSLGMDELCQFFDKDFAEWKGTRVQMDDVLMIGIEF